MNGRFRYLPAVALLALGACSSGDNDKQGTAPAAQPSGNVFSTETQALDKARSVNTIIQQSDQKRREEIDRQSQ